MLFLSIVGIVGFPWALAFAPLYVRVAGVLVGVVLGAGAGIRGICLYRKGSEESAVAWTVAGERVLIAVAAALWIALASFSAQVSIVPTVWIYGVCGVAVALPGIAAALVLRLCSQKRVVWWGHWLLLAVALGSVMLARPGRRFTCGHTDQRIVALARECGDVRDTAAWVHHRITRKPSPFTDAAIDTLLRGTARCGGLANLLDKFLRAQGVSSRIVHIEGRGRIHTLIEYVNEDGMWVLADPQENLLGADYGGLSGLDLVLRGAGALGTPAVWRGYDELYIYDRWNGYNRVTDQNMGAYYGDSARSFEPRMMHE
jgi:hypothetical protein